METKSKRRGGIDAALAAIVADGCFCIGFTIHLMSNPTATLTMTDYLGMAIILSVLITACWAIYHQYWDSNGNHPDIVKTLRIKELNEGAAIEFDGQSYRVDNINRSKGEIRIARVDRPGSIVVQIEGQQP